MIFTIVLLLAFLLFAAPSSAYAYLDPGSGSVLVSIIMGLAATAFYLLKNVFYGKARFFFKKNTRLSSKAYGVVFYSENKYYWNVFLPIIREFDRRGLACAYFASDPDDPGLSAEFPIVEKHCIGKGNEAFFCLNRLKADVVVMTTPGLDVLQLKRSKKVKHYCHIVHGLEDTSTYPPYGVDYFDSVLVNGQHQLSVIRELEKMRGLPEKQVEIIGSTYLDVIREHIKQGCTTNLNVPEAGKTILLAPSWGEKGFLEKFGELLLETIDEEEFNIILRPHPQSYISEADLLKRLGEKFAGRKNLIWDTNLQGLEAMQKSDIMISDFSGIIFDYVLLFEKPVIVTDFSVDTRKYDMNFLREKSSTLMKLVNENKIGYRINDAGGFPRVNEIVRKALEENRHMAFTDEYKEIIYCFPGQSGKRGADFLEKISGSLKQSIA